MVEACLVVPQNICPPEFFTTSRQQSCQGCPVAADFSPAFGQPGVVGASVALDTALDSSKRRRDRRRQTTRPW